MKKEAIALVVSKVIASFAHYSHNVIRYFLTKSCGILKLLLESTVKELGYD